MEPALDSAHVARLISQEIASCVLELISLEHKERDYLQLLERKAELESRISYLQQLEHSGMEGRL